MIRCAETNTTIHAATTVRCVDAKFTAQLLQRSSEIEFYFCFCVLEKWPHCDHSLPPPLPSHHVNWFIYGKGIDKRIALNVSWFDEGQAYF